MCHSTWNEPSEIYVTVSLSITTPNLNISLGSYIVPHTSTPMVPHLVLISSVLPYRAYSYMFPYSLPYVVGSFQLHETSTTPDLVNSLPQANLVSLPSKQQQKRANNIWYPDSGVTNHLTNGKPQGVEPYKGACTVQVGNDSHLVPKRYSWFRELTS